MKTFKIIVETKFTTEFEIEASTQQEAEEKLNDMYEEGTAYEIEMEQCCTDTNVVSIEEINNNNQ